MSKKSSSSINGQLSADTFNKSRRIINDIVCQVPEAVASFLSYGQGGIYRILSNVFHSAPDRFQNEFLPGPGNNEDRVPDFAGWLYSLGIFRNEVLLNLKAENDASLFDFVKTASQNAIIDWGRGKYKQEFFAGLCYFEDREKGASESVGQAIAKDNKGRGYWAEDKNCKFENKDLLDHIIDDARLSDLQTFIIQRVRKGYSDADIVEAYFVQKHESLSIDKCYRQKCYAMKKMRRVAIKYSQDR